MNARYQITSKGQITLPLTVRERLGVGVGDIVLFEMTDDGIQLTRDREPGVFRQWAGRLRVGSGQTAA